MEDKMEYVGLGTIKGSFEHALHMLKQGHKLTRAGWNGAGQWVAISPGYYGLDEAQVWNEHNKEAARLNGGKIDVLPYISLKNAQNKIICGWIPTAGDLFAIDWEIVD